MAREIDTSRWYFTICYWIEGGEERSTSQGYGNRSAALQGMANYLSDGEVHRAEVRDGDGNVLFTAINHASEPTNQ